MECDAPPTQRAFASGARTSPSFARYLPFAYESCGDDWTCSRDAAIDEYLYERVEHEVQTGHYSGAISPTRKRTLDDTAAEPKRKCVRQIPLQEVNAFKPLAFACAPMVAECPRGEHMQL